MVSMAFPNQVSTQKSIQWKLWTSEARNDVLRLVAQSCGLAGAAMFLYSLGPALGMTLIAVSLVVWSLLRSQIASDEDDGGSDEECGRAATLHSPSHCANPVWIRSDRFGTSSAAGARAVQRQGA